MFEGVPEIKFLKALEEASKPKEEKKLEDECATAPLIIREREEEAEIVEAAQTIVRRES